MRRGLTSRFFVLNRLRWYWRVPIKWGIFAFAALLVCFPYPGRLVRHIQHCRNPNALVEPDAPALKPFLEELRPRLSGDITPREALKRVERFVYEKIPYEWDWNTWGTADYLPTVTEVIEMGKEDCDGQAVIAASLLRNFGFNARLVANFVHMWVKTDQGETMSPGRSKAVVSGENGWRLQADALIELPRSFAFGVAVFPLLRELSLVFVLWLLLLRAKGAVLWSLGGLVCFLVALLLLRSGGRHYESPILWMQWLALAGLVGGFIVLAFCARHNSRAEESVAT